MRKRYAAAIAITVALGVGCGAQVDLESEQAAARAVVAQLWQAFETQDLDLISQVFAHDPDMVLLGTDAAERWIGYEAFMASMEEQAAAYDFERMSVRDVDIKMHGAGGVAWFSAVLDVAVVMTAGGERVTMEGARTTGVLEKRDTRWVVVQFHSSVPVVSLLIES